MRERERLKLIMNLAVGKLKARQSVQVCNTGRGNKMVFVRERIHLARTFAFPLFDVSMQRAEAYNT